ncbi:dephospho-CoA kinase [Exilibacterium tricleocarpae]|uniref:Dephospho-CoA kinase n=1 Tax=Exilibacterium tricleocarpae TaxID=2591008 RepID=A0A545TQF5_9GAMM|nr:dephospho-CoA kinase [Exilibacterium tricleocarpae]TQV79456.1 dephospho-CoA kinase [Exilibacterium tricleocarpae]
MFIVGLTGGIGSGKSAVSACFERLGVTVMDADIAARTVVEKGRPALAAIAEHFGADILDADGALNRAALRQIVFQDPGQRSWLERLLHPLIFEELKSGLRNATSAYSILVSPLLVETSQHRLTQRILVVDIPEQLQLARTMARDNNTEAQVKAIMKTQANRERRLKCADDVLVNDGNLEDLERAVEKLHQQYLKMAAEHGD